MGSHDGNLYAIDASTGTERWHLPTGDAIFSSPVVMDDTVFVGSADGYLRAVDVSNGTEIWRFYGGDSIRTSPAVAGGTVYFGSDDGSVYALAIPSPEQQTAVAEAQAAAETATAEAQASATSAAATAEAIETSWENYSNQLGTALIDHSDSLPGLHIVSDGGGGDGDFECGHPTYGNSRIPTDYNRCYWYEAEMTGGNTDDWAWTAIGFYDSAEEVEAIYQEVSNGLIRSGWQSEDVDGLDHDHTCLTRVTGSSTQAVCSVTRGNAIIVSYSYLSVPAYDAALQNAVDLANLMNDAYDQVNRPE